MLAVRHPPAMPRQPASPTCSARVQPTSVCTSAQGCLAAGMLPACSKPLVALCRHPSPPQPYRVAQYAPGMLALGLVAFLPMQLAWLYRRAYLSEQPAAAVAGARTCTCPYCSCRGSGTPCSAGLACKAGDAPTLTARSTCHAGPDPPLLPLPSLVQPGGSGWWQRSACCRSLSSPWWPCAPTR